MVLSAIHSAGHTIIQLKSASVGSANAIGIEIDERDDRQERRDHAVSVDVAREHVTEELLVVGADEHRHLEEAGGSERERVEDHRDRELLVLADQRGGERA